MQVLPPPVAVEVHRSSWVSVEMEMERDGSFSGFADRGVDGQTDCHWMDRLTAADCHWTDQDGQTDLGVRQRRRTDRD
jgi:hypothetical protein